MNRREMNMKKHIRTVAYWTTTILGPASFVIGGVLALTQNEQAIAGMHHLGYPLYVGSILGTWKLLGAIACVVPGLPRVKEWAYAGFFFDLTGAAASHAAVGDPLSDVLAPIFFLALVAASWALRPSGRTLGAPAAGAVQSSLVTVPPGALRAAA